MNKKVLVTVAALSLATSVGFASPLNDFSKGNVAVDISVRPSNDLKIGDTTFDGKASYEYGVTAGLGNKFAVQYKNYNPLSKDYTDGIDIINGKLDTQEFNVLYKLDKNFTAFTGVNQVQSIIRLNGTDYAGDTKNNWQFGVTGQTDLSDKLIGYATVAAGQDTSAYKLGLAYAIDKSLDFDLFYGQNKYNKVKFSNVIGSTADYTVKGVGYGVTYKF